jgi:hypothetical protein
MLGKFANQEGMGILLWNTKEEFINIPFICEFEIAGNNYLLGNTKWMPVFIGPQVLVL